VVEQIARKSWEATRTLLNTLEDIPYARSLEGRMWEELGHKTVLGFSTHTLQPLGEHPDQRIVGDVGPLYLIGLFDDIEKRAKDGILPPGYYQLSSKTSEATFDATAIVNDRDEHGEFQHVIFYQYTVSEDRFLSRISSFPHPAKAIGREKIKDKLVEMKCEQLLPFNPPGQPSRIRCHWSFVLVIPPRVEKSIEPAIFRDPDKKPVAWINEKVKQYLVVEMPETAPSGRSDFDPFSSLFSRRSS
jgi:hypothetical protein